MNALKRAWAYVRRKPTKTILLMITFFLIGNLVILGLGISEAAENAKILTRKSMRAVVSYEVDYDSYYSYINTLTDEDEINQAYQNSPTIDAAVAQELSKDERVIAFNYMVNTTAYSVGFDNVPVGNEENRGTSTYTDENGNTIEYRDPNIMIYANMYPDMIEFAEGTFNVVSGNMFTQSDIDDAKNVVLITQELADQNNLKVGDTITLTTMDTYSQQEYLNGGVSADDMNLELEICGIYTTQNDVDPSSENYKWMSPYESPKNIVLMPMTSYAAYTEKLIDIQVKVHPEYYDGINLDDFFRSAK